MDEAGWDREYLLGRYYYRFWESQGPDLFCIYSLMEGGFFLFIQIENCLPPQNLVFFIFNYNYYYD